MDRSRFVWDALKYDGVTFYRAPRTGIRARLENARG